MFSRHHFLTNSSPDVLWNLNHLIPYSYGVYPVYFRDVHHPLRNDDRMSFKLEYLRAGIYRLDAFTISVNPLILLLLHFSSVVPLDVPLTLSQVNEMVSCCPRGSLKIFPPRAMKKRNYRLTGILTSRV